MSTVVILRYNIYCLIEYWYVLLNYINNYCCWMRCKYTFCPINQTHCTGDRIDKFKLST